MNTRSKKTDGPKVLREMFEECEAGRWEAAAITRANTVEEVIVGDVPQIVTQGVHQLNSEDLVKLTSRDEIVSRYPVQPEGREFEDNVFDGTHVIEYLAPFPSGIVSSGEWPGQMLINHFLLGLTGCGYRAFHQDIKPPHDAIGTLFGGEKLWVFRAPGSRDTQRLVRAGQSTTMEEIQSKMRSKDGKRFFAGIQREGESLYQPYGWAHSVFTNCKEGVSCWLTVSELSIEEKELERRYKKLSHHAAVGIRRGDVAGSSR